VIGANVILIDLNFRVSPGRSYASRLVLGFESALPDELP
jgi:hypothetical protein